MLESIQALPVDSHVARNETTDKIREQLRMVARSIKDLADSFRHTGNTIVGDRMASWSNTIHELEMKLLGVTEAAIREDWRKTRNTPVIQDEITVPAKWPGLILAHAVTLPMNRAYRPGALYEGVFQIAARQYRVRAYAVSSAAGGKLLVAWDKNLNKDLTGEEEGSLDGETKTLEVNNGEYVVTVVEQIGIYK